ncbi:MAG TPA: carbohydrate porin, partial [Thermoguttaceae bacterium]|nr:carbohydrate porin [Thermoguttaceae bacterium]
MTVEQGRRQGSLEREAAASGLEEGPSENDATAAHQTDADNQDGNDQDADNQDEEKPPRLLGDRLHGRGPVVFEYIYTGEILSNTRGGLRTRRGTRYEGLFDLAMDVDLEKIRPRLPGKVHLLFQHTHGRSLSLDFVGDTQVLSTIDSFGNITQVSKYWWETTLGDDLLIIRLGKQDVNDEFHLVEMAADFVHSAAGIPATLPAPTYPQGSVAAVLLLKITESLSAKAGIWDGYPNGATWGFSNTGTTFTIVELERTHKLGGSLPGVIDLGFSHRSTVNVPGDFSPEQYTIYFDIEQMLYREDPCDEKNEQGLGCFFRYHTDFPRTE